MLGEFKIVQHFIPPVVHILEQIPVFPFVLETVLIMECASLPILVSVILVMLVSSTFCLLYCTIVAR